MITWATLLMCVAISADAFVVSLGKGLALKKIDKRAVLTVSIWFGAFHAFMPLIGWLAGTTFHEFIDKYDNWVMFLVMLILGIMFIREGLQDDEDDGKLSKDLTVRTMFPLAIATSLDALAAGVFISASATDVIEGIIALGVIAGCVSAAGLFLGGKFGIRYGKAATIAGGCLLLFIGILALLEEFGIAHFMSA